MQYEVRDKFLLISDLDRFDNKTVLDFLNYYKQSKKNRYLLILNQKILLNNKSCDGSSIIKKEDVLTLVIDDELLDFACDTEMVKVIAEDEFVLVVHKDAGYIVHEDDKNKLGTLANKVATYYQFKRYHKSVRYIHRLDKETQGLVMFSKISFFQPWLDNQLEEKKISRKYYAIVIGTFELGKQLTISAPIARNRHHANQMIIHDAGKETITHIQCISTKNNYSLLRCELETGRTHQIRLHLSYMGYPIVNDIVYGRKSKDFDRMGLFAYELSWVDPITHEKRIATDSFDEIVNYFK